MTTSCEKPVLGVVPESKPKILLTLSIEKLPFMVTVPGKFPGPKMERAAPPVIDTFPARMPGLAISPPLLALMETAPMIPALFREMLPPGMLIAARAVDDDPALKFTVAVFPTSSVPPGLLTGPEMGPLKLSVAPGETAREVGEEYPPTAAVGGDIGQSDRSA